MRGRWWHAGVDLGTIAVGIVMLAMCSMLARGELTRLEISVFEAVNHLPQGLYRAVWPLMQYGTFITIPVLALIAFAFRRFRLGLAMMLAGVSVYLLALVVKEVVNRGRPAALIDGVDARETFGAGSLGFPSGHAAVAVALTVVVAAHLSRRWAIAAVILALAVIFGRMYVGAHLPLDLLGGAALGAVAGGVANLVIPPSPAVVEEVGAARHDAESQQALNP